MINVVEVPVNVGMRMTVTILMPVAFLMTVLMLMAVTFLMTVAFIMTVTILMAVDFLMTVTFLMTVAFLMTVLMLMAVTILMAVDFLMTVTLSLIHIFRGFSDIWASAQDISFWDIGLAGSVLIHQPENRALIYAPWNLPDGRTVPEMCIRDSCITACPPVFCIYHPCGNEKVTFLCCAAIFSSISMRNTAVISTG